MDIENGLPDELVPVGALPRPMQVIDDISVFRLHLAASVRSGNIPDHTSPCNERDNRDSGRQVSAPLVSYQAKRNVVSSFDLTASTTATDEGEASVEIGTTTSRDSGSIPSFDSADLPLLKLENVTLISRSYISPELLSQLPPLHRTRKKKMATPAVSGNGSEQKQSRQGMFRKKMSSKHNATRETQLHEDLAPTQQGQRRSLTENDVLAPSSSLHESNSEPKVRGRSVSPPGANASSVQSSSSANEPAPRRGMLERIRSASRSRSRIRTKTEAPGEPIKPILVAVTSCRSDAYYNQKAPGSTSKLPRKAPSNLKLFHELAVGIKDAYAAVGQTPTRPPELEAGDARQGTQLSDGETILWEFFGNLDFVSVDGFSVDYPSDSHLVPSSTSFWHL